MDEHAVAVPEKSQTENGGAKTEQPTPSTSSTSSSNNMDILLRMGFPMDRAEKALTCTGDVSVPAAIDWILSHKDDPLLDVQDQREYLVYLCPSGPLLEKIEEFLNKTVETSGRNGAHLHMPHITMCHAFKTTASNIPAMLKALQKTNASVANTVGTLPDLSKLERYTSESFIGLFLDKAVDKVLKQLSESLVAALQPFSDKPIPHNSEKAFHLTLAYHFEASQFETIHALSKRIPLKTGAAWNILLLSRDARFHSHEVFKMVHPWSTAISHRDDEIPFIKNDYVYVAPKQNSATSTNAHPAGWVSAVSWSTGCSGVVPLTGIERTFSSDAWILHACIPYSTLRLQTGSLISDLNCFPSAQRARWVEKLPAREAKHLHPAEVESRRLDKYGVDQELRKQSATVQRKSSTGTKKGTTSSNSAAAAAGATAFVMRHGERMDFVFGVDWIHKCFDGEGNFTRLDLNMPKSVPKRRSGPGAYVRDPPLTYMGVFQAQTTGRAMKDHGITFSRVFTSPALRSIQTAAGVLEAFKDPPKLCIEPGLYEWLGWVREAHPDWLSTAELQAAGVSVDSEYQPCFSAHQLDFNEDVEGFYTRNGLVVRRIMQKHGHEGGNFLFVAHASSLDTCTRQLIGATPRSHIDMTRITQRVPYCAVVTCCPGPEQTWQLKNPPFPALTHGQNIKFNAIQTFITPESTYDRDMQDDLENLARHSARSKSSSLSVAPVKK